jgi:hypothetical protein
MISPAWFEAVVEIALIVAVTAAFGSAAALAFRGWRYGRPLGSNLRSPDVCNSKQHDQGGRSDQ